MGSFSQSSFHSPPRRDDAAVPMSRFRGINPAGSKLLLKYFFGSRNRRHEPDSVAAVGLSFDK